MAKVKCKKEGRRKRREGKERKKESEKKWPQGEGHPAGGEDAERGPGGGQGGETQGGPGGRPKGDKGEAPPGGRHPPPQHKSNKDGDRHTWRRKIRCSVPPNSRRPWRAKREKQKRNKEAGETKGGKFFMWSEPKRTEKLKTRRKLKGKKSKKGKLKSKGRKKTTQKTIVTSKFEKQDRAKP